MLEELTGAIASGQVCGGSGFGEGTLVQPGLRCRRTSICDACLACLRGAMPSAARGLGDSASLLRPPRPRRAVRRERGAAYGGHRIGDRHAAAARTKRIHPRRPLNPRPDARRRPPLPPAVQTFRRASATAAASPSGFSKFGRSVTFGTTWTSFPSAANADALSVAASLGPTM